MISKELLSEVLGFECVPHKEDSNDVWFEYEEEKDYGLLWSNESINIYELANACKEWAISKRYVTHSTRSLKEYVVYMSGDIKEPSDDFRAETEYEAIFKACEWILENR